MIGYSPLYSSMYRVYIYLVCNRKCELRSITYVREKENLSLKKNKNKTSILPVVHIVGNPHLERGREV